MAECFPEQSRWCSNEQLCQVVKCEAPTNIYKLYTLSEFKKRSGLTKRVSVCLPPVDPVWHAGDRRGRLGKEHHLPPLHTQLQAGPVVLEGTSLVSHLLSLVSCVSSLVSLISCVSRGPSSTASHIEQIVFTYVILVHTCTTMSIGLCYVFRQPNPMYIFGT